jgi:hypothetical protein
VAGIYPDLQRHVNPQDLREGIVPEEVDWLTILQVWWETNEKYIWGWQIMPCMAQRHTVG